MPANSENSFGSSTKVQENNLSNQPNLPVPCPFSKLRKNKTFKKNVLKRLKQIGPDPDNFEDINKSNNLYKLNRNDISEFLTNFQKKCQQAAEEEYKDFKPYNEICKLIDDRQDTIENEIGLEAIIHLEVQPNPSESDTVKFIQLYKMISDMMKGYPVEDLDDVNKLVFMEAYAELMVAVGSPKGEEDLNKLKTLFTDTTYEPITDSDKIQELKIILGDPLYNLFILPTDFLIRTKK